MFDESFIHPHWPGNQLDKRYVAEVGNRAQRQLHRLHRHSDRAGQAVGFSTEPPTQYVTVRNTCVTGSENAVGLNRDAGEQLDPAAWPDPSRGTALVSVTIHDPPLFAGTVLSETIRSAGIA